MNHVVSLEKRKQIRSVILNHIGDKEIFCFHPYLDTIVVSNKGRVKNILTGNFLNTHKNSNGYSAINVPFTHKGRRAAFLHRLICEAFYSFTGADNYFYEVNHIDGNKNNNNLENLEWLTRDENLAHSRHMRLSCGNFGIKNGNLKFSNQDLLDIKELHLLGFNYAQIARAYNSNGNWISKIVNGKARKVKYE